jgi:hypothetical protein
MLWDVSRIKSKCDDILTLPQPLHETCMRWQSWDRSELLLEAHIPGTALLSGWSRLAWKAVGLSKCSAAQSLSL